MRAMCAIVWDLDGTLYRGPEPLCAYFEGLRDRLDATAAGTFTGYATTLIGKPERVAPYRDLWNALTRASHDLGLPYADANACFLDVRARIIRGEIRAEVPQGMPSLVAELARARVPMAVVTNSDGASGRALLEHLGFGVLARRVQADAEKPVGFAPAVRALFPDLAPVRVLSVGDNYHNDIEPALKVGMAALHVRTPGAQTGPATRTVLRLEDAIGWIGDWALAERPDAAASGFGGTSA